MSENPFICSCDLLNITNNLSNDVKTMDNSATCWDVRKPVLTSLYYISNDLCTLKVSVINISLLSVEIVLFATVVPLQRK